MRRLTYLGFLFLLFCAMTGGVTSQVEQTTQTITLYSPNKYQHDMNRALFDFKTAALALQRGHWDLGYGLLYVGDDWDWFQVSANRADRSVVKDLGKFSWDESFEVPVVEPFPKLKDGEQRQVSIDASGADGADGAPGADGDGVVRARPSEIARSTRPKNDGTPKVDPIFVKALIGHMYVIHLVDDTRDFYALFRVEALERGDNCTISWRLIPTPAAKP
jgi:hypothetical protein